MIYPSPLLLFQGPKSASSPVCVDYSDYHLFGIDAQMNTRNTFDLILLAALWGASFLFMRIAADDFGPVVLIALRVLIASIFLLPILNMNKVAIHCLRQNWKSLFFVGVLNSALPFTLLAFTSLHLTAGFTSIINATAPLWGAMIAWAWLGDKLTKIRVLGLLIGFLGVVILLWNKLELSWDASSLAIPAGLLAATFYGINASFTKKYLSNVEPITTATGSQLGAAIVLLPTIFIYWPENSIPIESWISVIVLGVASTGVAYILYFRLIKNAGPANAISVTFLVPIFAVVWGGIFLSEAITIDILLGCAVILLGTALATGLLTMSSKKSKSPHRKSC